MRKWITGWRLLILVMLVGAAYCYSFSDLVARVDEKHKQCPLLTSNDVEANQVPQILFSVFRHTNLIHELP
jgi:uncharacterized SAM-binding protein YcdF (DUF218 family)